MTRRSVAALAALFLTACTSATGPSPTPPPATPTVVPSASPSASEAPSAEPSPTASTTEPLPADAIVVARVDGLRLRETPGTDGAELGTLADGYESIVVDGPEVADGLEWYKIAGLGLPYASGCATGPDPTNPFDCPVWLGWAARADADGTPWLEATEPTCADPAGSLDTFAFQPRYLYIACYGDEQLTPRGWLLASPGVPLEDPCPEVPEDLRWLGCVGSQFQLVSAPDGVIGLVMTFGPEAELPGGLVEIEVTGHFDDPAAAQCTYGTEPERSILDCRSQFVIESSGPVEP